MIQSERLKLRKIEDSDFEIIAKIMRDTGVQRVWEHYFSDDDVREWIDRRRKGYKNNGIDYLLAVNILSQDILKLINAR